jgi:hypothetical protein
MKQDLRSGKLFVTGLYGCPCHPLNSWDELKGLLKRKLDAGDLVRNRHTGKEGKIIRKIQSHIEGGFYLVSETGLEHGTNLILVEKKKKKVQ